MSIDCQRIVLFRIPLALNITNPTIAPWASCAGTRALRSLGVQYADRSTTGAVTFASSNSGNDAAGPTRGFAAEVKGTTRFAGGQVGTEVFRCAMSNLIDLTGDDSVDARESATLLSYGGAFD